MGFSDFLGRVRDKFRGVYNDVGKHIVTGASKFTNGLASGLGKIKEIKDKVVDTVGKVKDVPVIGGLLNKGLETLMNIPIAGMTAKDVLHRANSIFDSTVDTADKIARQMKEVEHKHGVSPAHQVINVASQAQGAPEPTGTETRMATLKSE
jgi:hypothetical protein